MMKATTTEPGVVLPLLVDTHAHLDAAHFASDAAQVIQRAREAQVEVVLMNTHLRGMEAVLQLARRHGMHCAVGLHPNLAQEADESLESRVREAARETEVVAVGEVGLDYYRNDAPPPVQLQVLRRQLALAVELNLPVVLHNRQATADLLGVLHEYDGIRGVFHCFTGSEQEARQCLDLGFYLGIGGPLTFARNEELRRTVRALPLDRLVLETDSPYLTPVPHRGRRNEPAHVRHVAHALGALMGLTVEQIAQRTTQNARTLFALSL